MELERRLSAGDDAAVVEMLSCVDDTFDGRLLSRKDESTAPDTERVDVFRAHLGARDRAQIVVQVRQRSALRGAAGTRREFYWIGTFAMRDGGFGLVASINRPDIVFCSFGRGPSGLWFRFTGDSPGEGAGMIVTEERTRSCGTLIDVSYEKTLYRMVDGELHTRRLEPPDGVYRDRLEGMRGDRPREPFNPGTRAERGGRTGDRVDRRSKGAHDLDGRTSAVRARATRSCRRA